MKHTDNTRFTAEDRNDGNGDIAKDMFLLEGEAAYQARLEASATKEVSIRLASIRCVVE